MRRRALVLLASFALAALTTMPVAAQPDDSSGDFTVTATDGTTLTARIVYPSGTKPSAGWPMVVYLHGGGSHRCSSMYFYSRAQMVSDGYAVVTLNGRGLPTPFGSGSVDSGATGCDPLALAKDGVNDSGFDDGGPVDRQDVSSVITAALAWSDTSGPDQCASPCVDSSKIAAAGYSYGGTRAWMMGVPGVDSRIKAIIPMASGIFQSKPTAAQLSSPANAVIDRGVFGWPVTAQDSGHAGHSRPSVWAAKAAISRDEFFNKATDSVVSTGSITSSTPTTLTISGSPAFTAADVGKPITISDSVEDGALDRTLETTILRYTSGTTVTLADAATKFGSSRRVSWGTQAWWDRVTLVDDNDAIDKAHLINIPTFVVNGFLDTSDGYNAISLPAAVEAWRKIPTSNKYLYLGSCGHSDAACAAGTTNASNLKSALKKFLDLHLKGTGGNVCAAAPPCVMYAIPPSDPTSTNWGSLTEVTGGSAAWPPASATSTTLYLKWASGAALGTLSTTAPSGTDVASKPLVNDAFGLAPDDYCDVRIYAGNEVQYYYKAAETSDKKIAKFQADIVLSSSTTRMQVVVDIYDFNPSNGSSRRILSGISNVPALRNATAGTKYTFTFQPSDGAVTIANGHQLLVAVASNFRFSAMQEPLSGTYDVWHKPNVSSEQSKITTWTV